MRSFAILATLLSACFLCSCATDADANKKKLANPGDELSVRPQGEAWKPSHVGSPLGLPMSN